VTALGLVRSRGLCGRGWSLVALAFCLAAVAASFATVTADQGAFDWRWWLLAFPLGACVAAVLLPVRNVLIGAAIVMMCFCVVASLSIGLFFVPAFVALVFATGKTQ
jgi:hypothetical protein